MVRTFWLFSYPKDVSIEEGEKWYLGVHTQEMKSLPKLRGYRTYKVLDVPEWPTRLVRFTELYWDSVEDWREAIKTRDKYTPPPWIKSIGSIHKPMPMITDFWVIDDNQSYDLLKEIPKEAEMV